jgi:glutathione peroxidase
MTISAYDFELQAWDGAPLDLAAFRGQPILIVNTASECVYTPQYAHLQNLWQTYRGQGLVVIAVPSNDFGGQEPCASSDIAAFCDRTFGVTFPLAKKSQVRGKCADPLFQWLAEEAGWAGAPRWNFYKYLIGRDGQLQDWFFCFTDPSASRVGRALTRAVFSASHL